MPPAKHVREYATPALDKGLDILELLAHQPDGLTKSEIARRLERTVSEIFRMLVCLERRGYIAQTGGEQYALTLRLFKLAQEHPPTQRLVTDALPVLQQLARETMQSCHLGVLEHGHITILAQVNAPANLGFYVKLGSTVSLMDAGSGYVLLAHMEPARRQQAIEDWMRESGRRAPRDLSAHLARIRRQGYEKHTSYQVKGVLNLSFPVFDDRGSPVAALTMPYMDYAQPPMSLAETTQRIRAAAAAISAALGHGPHR